MDVVPDCSLPNPHLPPTYYPRLTTGYSPMRSLSEGRRHVCSCDRSAAAQPSRSLPRPPRPPRPTQPRQPRPSHPPPLADWPEGEAVGRGGLEPRTQRESPTQATRTGPSGRAEAAAAKARRRPMPVISIAREGVIVGSAPALASPSCPTCTAARTLLASKWFSIGRRASSARRWA